MDTIPMQKETAPEYVLRAFCARCGRWLTIEEIKGEEPTVHSVRTLCSRAGEAVLEGKLISRYRGGRNYKEWTWFGREKPGFFFFELQGQYSALYDSYSDMDAAAKKCLYTPKDEISIFCGNHEKPEKLGIIRLNELDLVHRGFHVCPDCSNRSYHGDCIFCDGTGWVKAVEK